MRRGAGEKSRAVGPSHNDQVGGDQAYGLGKLLVLIDGRTVYSPLFSGTFWEVQDLVLDDIERIEVLRGPQSGLYGSDAIGGVIDIVTKKGSGPGHFVASVEGGSFGTFNQTGAASGSIARFNYAFNVSHFLNTTGMLPPLGLRPAVAVLRAR